MFFKKRKNHYSENLNISIEHLRNGHLNFIPWIFCVFTENSNKHKIQAARVLNKVLKKFSFNDICKTDIQMRQTTSMEWGIDWKSYSIDRFITNKMSTEEKRAVIIFSSFNPNGYIRHQAVEKLCYYEHTLPYIVLRQNDWVSNVRESALLSLSKRLKVSTIEEIVTSLPFIEKLRRSERCMYSSVLSVFSQEVNIDSILEIGLNSKEIISRKFCISILDENISEEKQDLLQNHIKKEKDPFLRRQIFQLLLKSNIEHTKLIEQFLKDKNSCNRFLALQFANNSKLLSFQNIKDMLLDKNKNIRAFLRDIIKEIDPNFNFHGFYLDSIKQNPICSIYGLGEVGRIEDCNLIEKYLNGSNNSVIRAAMISLMRLNPEKYNTYITEMLLSESKGIVKTSTLLLKKYGNYDLNRILEISQTTNEYTKLKCMYLLFCSQKWKRLIYILSFIDSEYNSIHNLCTCEINKWISSYNHSYASATGQEKERIIELIYLKRNYINEKLQKKLLFFIDVK